MYKNEESQSPLSYSPIKPTAPTAHTLEFVINRLHHLLFPVKDPRKKDQGQFEPFMNNLHDVPIHKYPAARACGESNSPSLEFDD